MMKIVNNNHEPGLCSIVSILNNKTLSGSPIFLPLDEHMLIEQ